MIFQKTERAFRNTPVAPRMAVVIAIVNTLRVPILRPRFTRYNLKTSQGEVFVKSEGGLHFVFFHKHK